MVNHKEFRNALDELYGRAYSNSEHLEDALLEIEEVIRKQKISDYLGITVEDCRSLSEELGYSIEDTDEEIIQDIEPEDLVNYGLIPEFVGRLPMIATLQDLDIDALVRILTEPKNSLVKQFTKLFKMEEVELEFKDQALAEVAKKAIKRKTGARGLRSILEKILLDS